MASWMNDKPRFVLLVSRTDHSIHTPLEFLYMDQHKVMP